MLEHSFLLAKKGNRDFSVVIVYNLANKTRYLRKISSSSIFFIFSLILLMGVFSPALSSSWAITGETSKQQEIGRVIPSKKIPFTPSEREILKQDQDKILLNKDQIQTFPDGELTQITRNASHLMENEHHWSDAVNPKAHFLNGALLSHEDTPLKISNSIRNHFLVSSTVGGYNFPKATVVVANSNPIQISNDTDFANQAVANGWPGNGSINNPYIIENLVITANATSAINITNTYVSFIIRNNTLIGSWDNNVSAVAGGVAGISLQRVYGKAFLEGNTITNFSHDGVRSVDSRVKMRNNVAYNNGYSGFNLRYSRGSLNLSSNIVYNNVGYGIYISDSNVYEIENNTVYNNSWSGLVISFVYDGNFYASDRIIRANRAMANQMDGFVIEGHSSQLTGNVAEDNGDDGFFFFPDTRYSKVMNNTARNNGGDGFHLNATSNMEFKNNSAYNNSNAGFFIWDDWYSVVTSNVATANGRGFYVLGEGSSAVFVNNTAKRNVQSGFFIEKTNYMTIENNLAILNGGSGFYFLSTMFMTVRFDTAVQNYGSGFYASDSDQITFDNNLASHNEKSGFAAFPKYVNTLHEATFTNNNASYNQFYGFVTTRYDIILNNNTAFSNGITGFQIVGNYGFANNPYVRLGRADVTNNSARSNGEAGFSFEGLVIIVVESNVVVDNVQEGIVVDFLENITIINNEIQNNGIVLKEIPYSTLMRIENNTVNGNPVIFIQDQQYVRLTGAIAGQIILFNVSHATITNQVINNTDIAFQLIFVFHSTLMNNVAINNRLHGYFLSYSMNNSILNNVARYNGRHGFYFSDGLTDTLLSNNTAEFNGRNGFLVIRNFTSSNYVFFERNEFSGNVASNNGENGFFITRFRNGMLTNNIVQANAFDGFRITFESKYNMIQDNLAFNNGGDGFYLSGSTNFNTFMRNIADANLVDGYHFFGVQYNTFIDNNATNNKRNGFYLYGSNNNGLQNNTALFNEVSGFVIDYFSSENRLTRNEAHHNFENGYVVNSTSSNNVLSDNSAFSNNMNGFYLHSSTNNTLISNIAFSNKKTGYVIIETAISSTYQDRGGTLVRPLLVGNWLENNVAYNNTENGFGLYSTSNNTLVNNIAYDNIWVGFSIESASVNNTLFGNDASFNEQGGFSLWFANIRNQLVNNTARHNNGSGFSLVGSNGTFLDANLAVDNRQDGFVLNDSDNNTLKNNIARDNLRMGMFLIIRSTNNVLIGNLVANNAFYGILLYASWNNTLLDNVFFEGDGVVLGGTTIEELSQQKVSGNMVNGKPLVFLQHQRQVNVTEPAGQIILVNSSYIQIRNQVIIGTDIGFQLLFSDRNKVERSTSFFNSFVGFFLKNSSGNSFSHNIASYNYMYGFTVTDSSVENVFSFNSMVGNAVYGMHLDVTSGSNRIVSNDFWLNNNKEIMQAYSDNSNNDFRNNFWDTHVLPDSDRDGIVDSPQMINGSGGLSDLYPLTKPSNVFDEKAPSISGTSELIYANGTTGHFLKWEVLDEHGGKYIIYQDGTMIGQGSWNPDDFKIITVDNLEVGSHVYEIIFIDAFNNSNSYQSLVTVIEATPPTLTNPEDMTFELGLTGLYINWTVVDVESGTYDIYQDGVVVVSGTWISGVDLFISLDALDVGAYNFTIVVKDIFGTTSSDTVFVNVVNVVGPDLSSPPDLTYEVGTTGNAIVWVSADPNPGSYEIYRNGTLIASGSWFSGVNIAITVDGLPIGAYNFTIIVSDSFGASSRDTVHVIVEDGTSPVLDAPSDIVYYEGTVGHFITWSVTDAHPNSYEIYQNGTVIATGTWNAGYDITIDVDGLTIGIYNYTIVVYDLYGNFASDTVLVTVMAKETVTITSSPSDTSTNSQHSNKTTTTSSRSSGIAVTTTTEVTTPVEILSVLISLGFVFGFRSWKSFSKKRSKMM